MQIMNCLLLQRTSFLYRLNVDLATNDTLLGSVHSVHSLSAKRDICFVCANVLVLTLFNETAYLTLMTIYHNALNLV